MKKTIFILCAASFFACGGGSKESETKTSGPKRDTASGIAVKTQSVDSNMTEGAFVARYPNGVIKTRGEYHGGKRDGQWTVWYENGQLWSEGFYKKGLREGAATTYYDNGKKETEGSYKKGEPVGKWMFYDSTGAKIKEVNLGKK